MSALALLLALASPVDSAIEAERAFARMAQTDGQWTAFRHYAAHDAVMFVPEARNVHETLADAVDPISSVMWWPDRSFVSCDGAIAVNTGSWVRSRQQRVGYFTTIWERQPDGEWRWLLDHGDRLEEPRPVAEQPAIRRAACPENPLAEIAGDEIEQSPDGSLRWTWNVAEDGSRVVRVEMYDGTGYQTVILDEIAAPAP
ncbi:MAG: hypothetical protein HKN78_09795 [Sphingomonadaceae bacterium]|nr:hypothetical protein [Sphingomonadaceae bacterium]